MLGSLSFRCATTHTVHKASAFTISSRLKYIRIYIWIYVSQAYICASRRIFLSFSAQSRVQNRIEKAFWNSCFWSTVSITALYIRWIDFVRHNFRFSWVERFTKHSQSANCNLRERKKEILLFALKYVFKSDRHTLRAHHKNISVIRTNGCVEPAKWLKSYSSNISGLWGLFLSFFFFLVLSLLLVVVSLITCLVPFFCHADPFHCVDFSFCFFLSLPFLYAMDLCHSSRQRTFIFLPTNPKWILCMDSIYRRSW